MAWKTFFQFLPPEVIDETVERVNIDTKTLTMANRIVSNELYLIATERGWKKLTRKEREKFGLSDKCWHRESAVLEAREKYNSLGVGKYTIDSARG